MDSMAVYRRMDIGTAKPTAEERARVPHHLVDVVEPSETFDTARWCKLAQERLDELRAAGRKALFVGGTPLYLMAFFKGLMEGPEANPELRSRLEAREQEAPGALHEELSARDPEAASRIHRKDTRRLVRALEVLELTGKTISSQQEQFEQAGWKRDCRVIQTTRQIRDDGGFSRTAGAAIGYAECLDHLRGRWKDRTELRNRIRRNTHKLVRRQTTWLRRLPELLRMPPTEGVDGLRARLEGDAPRQG